MCQVELAPLCSVDLAPAGCGLGGFAGCAGAGGAEAVAVGAGFDDVGVEGDAVDDGGDEAGVGDDGASFAEGEVGGDGDAGFLFAFGEDLEEEFAAAGVELDVAEFVEAEQVESSVSCDDACEASFVGGFGEFVDELRGGGVADSASLFTGGDAESDEEVAFAGAGIAEQDDGFAGVEVVAGGERGDGCGVDGGVGVEVEIREAFVARETGFVDVALAAPNARLNKLADDGASP